MVVVGSDVHERRHPFGAVDDAGRRVAELTVKADLRGHDKADKAITWAREFLARSPGGRSRTVGTCRRDSSLLCWRPVSRWYVCRPR